jgi:hypothetical protein
MKLSDREPIKEWFWSNSHGSDLTVITVRPLIKRTLFPRRSYTYSGTVMPMFVQW